MKFRLLIPLSLTFIFQSGGTAWSDVVFREIINSSTTARMTAGSDRDKTIMWSRPLPGNQAFDLPTRSVSFTHSIDGIRPPILPDGTLKNAMVKLLLRNCAGLELAMRIDPVNFDEARSRIVYIGPTREDSVRIEGSPLSDGSFNVHIVSHGRRFALLRSVLEVTYTPATPSFAINDSASLPDKFTLEVNNPGPDNPSATIRYGLPSGSHVHLEILNALGDVIRNLVDEISAAGHHSVTWNGRDQTGKSCPRGVYFSRLVLDKQMAASKKILLR